jgi:hypothetical protein
MRKIWVASWFLVLHWLSLMIAASYCYIQAQENSLGWLEGRQIRNTSQTHIHWWASYF